MNWDALAESLMGRPCFLVNSYHLLYKKHHSVFLQWNILMRLILILWPGEKKYGRPWIYPWFTSMTLAGATASLPRDEDPQLAPALVKPNGLKHARVSLAPQTMQTSWDAPPPSLWISWQTGHKHSTGLVVMG